MSGSPRVSSRKLDSQYNSAATSFRSTLCHITNNNWRRRESFWYKEEKGGKRKGGNGALFEKSRYKLHV